MPMPSDLPPMGEKIDGYTPLPPLKKISTGITGLDLLLLGGLKPKSTTLLIGPSGYDKETFALQFSNAALEGGDPVIYSTLDKAPAELESTAMRFGWNLSRHTNQDLKFIDCYSWTLGGGVPSERADMQVQGPSALNDLSIALSQSMREIGQKGRYPRIVLHSLSTLLLYNQPDVVFKFIQVTGSRLKTSGATTLLLLEPGMHDEKTVSTIKHLVDEVIELKVMEAEGLYLRMLQGGITSWIKAKSTPGGIEIS